MKFVQIGDVHFDVPFTTISDRLNLGEQRRLEQRKAFKKVIDYIKDNDVENLFICGDLYENEYIRSSTIEYINKLFKEIENTQIFIIPGNHDPFLNDSFYKNFKWNSNVKIFGSKIEKVELDNVNIYGYGFDDFELNKNLEEIELDNNKFNILLTHGDLYNASKYNAINLKDIINKGFDYIAIGHIHKRDEYYSGSLISLGFDEPGEHGFIYGEVNENKLVRKFVKADSREFITMEIDVSKYESKEDLIEALNEIDTKDNLYEIIFVGNRKFDIEINIKLLQENIVKIKDKTKYSVNLEQKENEKTLTGFFIKNLKEELNNQLITEEEYEKILELGSNILNK